MRKRLFLILTDCGEGYEGTKVRINFDHVVSYCKGNKCTEIETEGDKCFSVKETPEEIDLAIGRSEEE